MPLTLYNTLTRRKEQFEPIDPTRVGLYVCGPTVYDRAHIGNARAVVAFDLLYRVLRHEYGPEHVRYIRNITDVEDKIIAAARENREPIDALTRRTTAIFHEDMSALNNLPPDVEPRATEYIPQMIAMIERLIASGHAYAAEGHALFRVTSYAEYGALSRRSRADMIAGARVEIAPYKEDPGDFVLWKPSNPEQPGWDSPWGRGRPGWHIECSAMSETELGETFDIHGGGLDLIFPHHENEIAQSVCAHAGHPFARYWLHNGMLTVGGVKMAKSEGNFITVGEALDEAPGEVVRLALLGTHYRDPLDWTPDRLQQARQSLDRWYRALSYPVDGVVNEGNVTERVSDIVDALHDDLNFPLARTKIDSLARRIALYDNRGWRATNQEALRRGGRLMGLLEIPPEEWFQSIPSPAAWQQEGMTTPLRRRAHIDPTVIGTGLVEPIAPLRHSQNGVPEVLANIKERIAARAEARRERRFDDADRIRAELFAKGVAVEDGPQGTTWRNETSYWVQLWPDGKWDRKPYQRVNAISPKEAAEKLYGGPLHEAGSHHQIRAQVRIAGLSSGLVFYEG
jgi:cysteinyl-tRNA synthetase